MKSLLVGVIALGLFAGCKAANRSDLEGASFTDNDATYVVYYETPTFYVHKCKSSASLVDAINRNPDSGRTLCTDAVTPITITAMSEAIRKEMGDISSDDLITSKSKRYDLIAKKLESLSRNATSLKFEIENIYKNVADDNPDKQGLRETLRKTERSIAEMSAEQQQLKQALDEAKQESKSTALRDLDVQDTLRLAGMLNDSAQDYAEAFTKLLMSQEVVHKLDPLRNRILRNAIVSFSPACERGGPGSDSELINQGVERIRFSCSQEGVVHTLEIQCPLPGYEKVAEFCIFTGKGLELSEFAASHNGLCAVANNKVTCWGKAGSFPMTQPMQGSPPFGGLRNRPSMPLPVPPISEIKASSIVASDLSMCGQDSGRKISRCWHNVADAPVNQKAYSIVRGGYAHYCGITEGKTVECWGQNEFTQARPPTGLENVKAIALSDHSSCALTEAGKVACWGQHQGRQKQESAAPPSDLGTALAISAGPLHACAILSDRKVRCWGQNDYGQNSVPADLGPVKSIEAARYETCAITEGGALRCWGTDAAQADSYHAAPALQNVQRLKTGILGSNTCAIYGADAKVACWGSGMYTGPYMVTPPADLQGVSDLAITAVGYICAKLQTGGIRCWGNFQEVPAMIPEIFRAK